MSNSFDPDQARRFVGPDLGPNCLPRLSADDTGRERVKEFAECKRAIEKWPPGRPTRNAALKAAVNARIVEGKMPQLFQCLYCKAYCFGNNLIKSHLSLKHKRQIMKAMDVEKDGQKIPSTVYFCGSENCNSTFPEEFPEEKELIKHSKMQHN